MSNSPLEQLERMLPNMNGVIIPVDYYLFVRFAEVSRAGTPWVGELIESSLPGLRRIRDGRSEYRSDPSRELMSQGLELLSEIAEQQ
tara:strand:+ start:358 stop:618 length:261 start_codon:yes stop_codon:yes gene_type:complete